MNATINITIMDDRQKIKFYDELKRKWFNCDWWMPNVDDFEKQFGKRKFCHVHTIANEYCRKPISLDKEMCDECEPVRVVCTACKRTFNLKQVRMGYLGTGICRECDSYD